MRASARGLLAHLYRIRYRLLLVNLLVVAVPVAGIGFARFYEREMLAALEKDMIHQAQLLRQALLDDPSGPRLAERGAMLARAARDTRTRIRLLDPTGRLVADSHGGGPPEGPEPPAPRLIGSDERVRSAGVDPDELPDLAARREIRMALRGQYGAATRLWERVGRVFLFSALPIERDGQVLGVVYVTRSTAPVKLAMFRLRSSLFDILLLSLAVTVVLSLFLAATISRPLARLTRTARRVAAGERGLTLALARRDEIGELARAFDRMAGELEERARWVSELAANVSHEFKSPLTSIRGAAELLQDGAADDPAARARFLGNILDDCRRLDRLVTRLLELSRVEADVAPLEVLDYEALVRQAAREARGTVAVVVEYHGPTQVHGRRAHLLSALACLLENAGQHAAAGTTVTVRVTAAAAGGLRTAVHDVGPPVSEANLPRVWDRFFTTRADRGGTGLGLAIVASVAKAHGGAVGVTSTAAEGTTFWLDLPLG